MPYAKDRLVELYFWILGVYFEPKYALARKMMTKVIYITSIIDDTYDAYGTFEELELFTEAVKRFELIKPIIRNIYIYIYIYNFI